MGFYSYFYDNEQCIENEFSRRFSEKWAGGNDFWDWCFKQEVPYHNDIWFPGFKLEKETIERAIKDKVMGKTNTEYLLKPMLEHIKEEGLDCVFFVGNF